MNSITQSLQAILPEWALQKSLVLSNFQWLGILFVIILAFIAKRVVTLYIVRFLVKIISLYQITVLKEEKRRLSFPFGLLSFAVTWSLGIQFLGLPQKLISFFLKGGHILITVALVLVIARMVDFVSLYFLKKAKETENKIDDIIVPLIQRSIKFFVYAAGIVFIGDALDFNMRSVLTGLGIGGVAIAFAAKDTLGNFFGSLMIILDRPFSIGDWVNIDEKVEGTIEEVGLRSTKIRTFYDSIVSIPNVTLITAHINNYGRRRYRRFMTTLGLQYDTPPKKIEAFCEGVRQLIANHPYTRKDYFNVYFTDYGASSLNVLLYVFFEVKDYANELAQRHRLLIDILRLADELKVDFAFPTQTLHVFSEQAKAHQDIPQNPFEAVKNISLKISEEQISAQKARSNSKELN